MPPPGPPHRIVVADPAALVIAATERLLARIASNPGRVAICLTGGGFS
jgi:6-phosphogluconolactonase